MTRDIPSINSVVVHYICNFNYYRKISINWNNFASSGSLDGNPAAGLDLLREPSLSSLSYSGSASSTPRLSIFFGRTLNWSSSWLNVFESRESFGIRNRIHLDFLSSCAHLSWFTLRWIETISNSYPWLLGHLRIDFCYSALAFFLEMTFCLALDDCLSNYLFLFYFRGFNEHGLW